MPRDIVLRTCDGAEAWHVECRASLNLLDDLLHHERHPPGLLAPWEHFARGMRTHFEEEEQVLFPALRALARGQAPRGEDFLVLLEEMEQELDEIRTISDALRNAARDGGELEQRILELLDDLEEHARREEEELLPAAKQLVRRWQQPDVQQAPPPPVQTPTPRPEGSMLRRTARKLRGLLRR